jgi:hypothetical protein
MSTENTTFDLEWAKRGGVFVYKTVVDPIWTAKLIGVHKSGMLNIVFTTDLSTERCFRDDMRMATRAESDAAGAEYIEPPVGAEELAELRKDKQRLDWMTHIDHQGVMCKTFNNGYICAQLDGNDWYDDGDDFETARDAIDYAMAGGE